MSKEFSIYLSKYDHPLGMINNPKTQIMMPEDSWGDNIS